MFSTNVYPNSTAANKKSKVKWSRVPLPILLVGINIQYH